MNTRAKLTLLGAVSISVTILFSLRFGQNIRNIGLLNFIGIPTIIVVAICHGIAFLIRLLLVKRHCRSAGISHGNHGNQEWISDLSITNKQLFAKIEQSFKKTAALFFLLTAVFAGIVSYGVISFKDMPNEEVEHHIIQYWFFMASYGMGMIMFFFVVHFLFLSFLLEYKSRGKAVFVTVLSFMVVFLSTMIF